VRNDGVGGHTALFLDKVSLLACGIGIELIGVGLDIAADSTSTPMPVEFPTNLALAPFSMPLSPFPISTVLPIPTALAPDDLSPARSPLPVPRIVIAGVFTSAENESSPHEYIVLLNLADTLHIDRWTISDGQGNRYTFNNFTFDGGSAVRIHSDSGEDTQTDLFWGRTDSAWGSNEGHEIVLKDPTGTKVDAFTLSKRTRNEQ
jgi:hypothetical protein